MRTLALLTCLLPLLGCTASYEARALDRQPQRSRPRASTAASASSVFVTLSCESFLLEAGQVEEWLGSDVEGVRVVPLALEQARVFLGRFRRRVQHPPPSPVLTVKLGESLELADLREEREGPEPLHRTGAGIALRAHEVPSGPWVVFSGTLWTREARASGEDELDPVGVAQLVHQELPLRLELRDGESALLAPPARGDGLQRVVLLGVIVHELR